MRYTVPHPIPYQGSKRRLANAVLSHLPVGEYKRLVEPFAGSGAITLAAASRSSCRSYILGDALGPLVNLWTAIIDGPEEIAAEYEALWQRERRNPIDAYYEIRDEFNSDRGPAKLLYLLARCVKNSVRFNPSGEFNQSPDKRRTGTRPVTMQKELNAAHHLLRVHAKAVEGDFMALFEAARPGDFFYLDPPYQGTSDGRDRRYIEGVSRERLMQGLELLNEKEIPFLLSYDGSCGDKSYGQPLPAELADRILLDVGRSSQATLNGNDHVTIESLYVSRSLNCEGTASPLPLAHFDPQPSMFA